MNLPSLTPADNAPDCPDRWSMPPSECVSHYFATREDANTYYHRQQEVAKARDPHDCFMATLDGPNKWRSEFEVRMWYGPYPVWFEAEEFYGYGDVEHREGDNYLIRVGYPYNDKLVTVPITATERLLDTIHPDGRLPEQKRRAIMNHSGHRREPPPPPPTPRTFRKPATIAPKAWSAL